MKNIKIITFIVTSILFSISGCTSADVVSQRISKDAEEFKITRRIVFFNGITDKYLLTITGKCSIDIASSRNIKVTCKDDNDNYVKHYLGLSDNVTYFAEQIIPTAQDTLHYKVILSPATIVPDIVIRR